MKKRDLILFSVIFSILLLIGGTYARWMWSSTNNKSIVFNTSKEIAEYIVYNEGFSHFVGDFQPASTYCDSISSTISFYKTTGDAEKATLKATIYMDVNFIEENISNSSDVYWVITSGDATACTGFLDNALNSGTFTGKVDGDVITLLDNVEITTSEQEFTVWIWIDEGGSNLSLLSGETVDTNIWTQVDMVSGEQSGILSGGAVKITGDNDVGKTLIAMLTNTSPNADNYIYQWYTNTENSTTGGTLISDVTTNTLSVDSSYVGKYIYVIVTANKDNYISTSFSDITDVNNNKYAAVSKTIPTLTVSKTNLDIVYPNNGSFTYTYDGDGTVSCSSSNIYTATCSVDTSTKTVTIVPEGAGDVVITVTASESIDYATVSQEVDVYVEASTMSGGAVSISGNNIVGSILTVDVTNTTPTADSYTYQWYYNTTTSTNDGTAISGATSDTLTLTNDYLGKYIYIVVSAVKSGYVTKRIIDITDSTNNTYDVVTKLTPTFTVSSSTLTTSYPNTGSFTYTYNGDGAVTCSSSSTNVATCSVNTTTKTVTVTPVSVGSSTITLNASEGTSYNSATQIVSVTVNNGTLSGGSVTISGTNSYNSVLTATVTDTDPVATYSYQWYTNSSNSTNGGTAISGATASTLTLPISAIDKYVYVVVNASKTYYNSKSLTAISSTKITRIDPTLTVSTNTLSTIYPNSTSFTYTYDGDGTLSCSISDTTVSECSVNTATNTVSVTAKKAGTVNITLSASQGTIYNSVSQIVTLTVEYETYAINYYSNITTGESPWYTDTKTYGTNYTITSTAPTRQGFRVVGWSTSSTDATVIYEAGDVYSTNAALDLYAVWEVSDFTINEDFADTTWDSNITNISSPTTDVTVGSTDYTFAWSATDGQFKTNTGSVTASSYTGATLTSGNITSTIIFTPTSNRTLSFDYGLVMNDSSPATLTIKLTNNDDVSVSAATTSTYTAMLTANTTYTLELITSHTTRATYSWMGSSAKTTAYAYIDNLVVNTITTYTVSYDANGGDGAPGSQTKISGESITLSSTEPTRDNYTFVSWNTESDGSGTSYSSGGVYNVDSSVTLYAIWQYVPPFNINEDFADTTWDSNITNISSPTTDVTVGSTDYTFAWSATDGQFKTNTGSVTASSYTGATLTSGNITSTIIFTPTSNRTLSFDYGLVMNDSSPATLTIKLTNNDDVSVTAATTSTYTASLTANTTYTLELVVSHTTKATYSFMGGSAKTTAYAYIDNLVVS